MQLRQKTWKQSLSNPCTFVRDWRGFRCAVTIHVDDMAMAGPAEALDLFEKEFDEMVLRLGRLSE